MKNGNREEWFHDKYEVDTLTGCWNWTAAINAGGYGVFGVDNSNSMLAHRYSFKKSNGFITRCVCHKCDNRKCVNPSHLFGGSYQENTDDAIRKGRHKMPPHPIGLSHPRSKITLEIIESIRNSNNIPQRKLAKQFGISQRTVGRYVK